MNNATFNKIKKISLVAIVLLISAYVIQVQAMIYNAHQQGEYAEQKQILSQKFKNLQNQYTEANSLDKLLPRISQLNLEKVNQVNYIKLSSGQVVVNK